MKDAETEDYTVETRMRTERVDSLAVKACGCIIDTPENKAKCLSVCGSVALCGPAQSPGTVGSSNNINNGTWKIDEEGGVIHILSGSPEKVVLSYVSSGEGCAKEILIPDYAVDCLMTGTYYRSLRFRSNIALGAKDAAKRDFESEKHELVQFLNPLDAEEFQNIQNRPTIW